MSPMTRKYCVINCEKSEAWSPLDFGDMFTNCLRDLKTTDEWVTINVAKGESVPDPVECLQYHAVVLTGSRYNARDGPNLPWFEPLCALIQSAAATGSPRIYAGCFGCQIVAHALGGVVDYNPNRRFVLKAETITVVNNFSEYLLSAQPPVALLDDAEEYSSSGGSSRGCCSYSETEEPSPCAVTSPSLPLAVSQCCPCPCPCNIRRDSDLLGDVAGSSGGCGTEGSGTSGSETQIPLISRQLSESCCEGEEEGEGEGEGEGQCCDLAQSGGKSCSAMKALKIIVSHGDCVETLPPKSTLLGSSPTCRNEMYVSGTFRNIFSCQSHPEFEYDYCIKDRIWPSVVTLNNRLSEEEIRTAEKSFADHTREDSEALLGVIKSFLKLPCTCCLSCRCTERA